jgi:hypothetical protein
LRLNFQILQGKDGSFRGVRDYNIHAIYELSASEFADVVATLRTLHKNASVDTMSLPLLPHPVIAKEGAEGAYFKGIIGIVHRFARASKMTNLAFLADTAPGLGGHWPMVTAIVRAGKATFIDIPSTFKDPLPTYNMVQRMDGHGAGLEDPIPMSTSKVSLYPQDNDALRLKNSFTIENPHMNDAVRLDCASCHTAMSQRQENYRRLAKSGAKPVVPKEAFTSSHWDLSVFIESPEETIPVPFRAFRDGTSLQMFSYFMGSAKITQRVVNETAVVADFINSKM